MPLCAISTEHFSVQFLRNVYFCEFFYEVGVECIHAQLMRVFNHREQV